MEVVQRRWNISCWLDQHIHFGIIGNLFVAWRRCQHAQLFLLLPLLPRLPRLLPNGFRNCKLSVISMSDLEKREEKRKRRNTSKSCPVLLLLHLDGYEASPQCIFESLHPISPVEWQSLYANTQLCTYIVKPALGLDMESGNH